MDLNLPTLGFLLILVGLIFGIVRATTLKTLRITTLSSLSVPILLIIIGVMLWITDALPLYLYDLRFPPTPTPFQLTATPVHVTATPVQPPATPLQPSATKTDEQFRLFMSFYYPEIKDLTINFLTLASSIFAFSVVFAEKVVTLKPPFTKSHYPIIISWIFFVASIVLGGMGLWWLYTAGEIANGSLVLQYDIDFIQLLRNVYTALDLAGFCFVGALIMLAVSALTKLRKQQYKSVSKSA